MAGLAGKFESWPGPIIEMQRDGSVAEANQQGRELVSLMLASEDNPLRGLVSLAFDAGGSVSDRIEVVKDGKTSW